MVHRSALLLAALLAACSSSDTTDSGSDAGGPVDTGPRQDAAAIQDALPAPDAAPPEDAGDTPDSGTTACATPTNARVVASTANGTLPADSTIGEITVDGTTLYLGTRKGIVSVPAAGGAGTTIYPNTEYTNVFGVMNDALVIATGQGDIGTIPKTGGALTPFAFTLDQDGQYLGFDSATNEYYLHETTPLQTRVRAQSLVTGTVRMLAEATVRSFRFDHPTFLRTSAAVGFDSPVIGGSPNKAIIRVPKNGDPVVYGEITDATINAASAVLGLTDERAFFYHLTGGSFTVVSTDLAGGDVTTHHTLGGDDTHGVRVSSATHVASIRFHRLSPTERNVEVYAFDASTSPANGPIKSTIEVNDDACIPRFAAIALSDTELFLALEHENVEVVYAIPL